MTPWFNLPKGAECGWQGPGDVAIIGAGLAGLCSARALLSVGFEVTVYEAGDKVASGASASPAGIVKPYVTRQPSDAMRFYEQAYKTLFQWLNELPDGGCFQPTGALQLEERPYPGNSARYENLDAPAASIKAGLTLQQDALYFKQAGWLSVEQLCQRLLADVKQRGGKVVFSSKLSRLTRIGNVDTSPGAGPGAGAGAGMVEIETNPANGEWELTFHSAPSVHCQQVVLASGTSLIDHDWLPKNVLFPARGQITAFNRDYELNTVISARQYAIPDKQCVWVGATFDRGNSDDSLIAKDDELNRQYATSLLTKNSINTAQTTQPSASALVDKTTNSAPTRQRIVDRFAGVRCTTLDRFPIVGPVPILAEARARYHDIHHGRHLDGYRSPAFYSGLAVMGGFGSRGIAAAPHASVLLANWASGRSDGDATETEYAPTTSTLYSENRLLSPLRFLIRQLKRGH